MHYESLYNRTLITKNKLRFLINLGYIKSNFLHYFAATDDVCINEMPLN